MKEKEDAPEEAFDARAFTQLLSGPGGWRDWSLIVARCRHRERPSWTRGLASSRVSLSKYFQGMLVVEW